MVSSPGILALDFDGVICDGLKEYFQTAWKAYNRLWQPEQEPSLPELAARFYRLRPVVETGWEMPLVLRAILTGVTEAQMFQDWPPIARQILADNGLESKQVAAIVDGIRDEWIAADLDSWLAEQRFYPGVIGQLQRLQASPTQVYIISTKEGRFIKQLLARQGVVLEDAQVWGKEAKRPKHQILRELISTSNPTGEVWFVEDRLKTLHTVQAQPDLASVRLFLADWGYNTAAERQAAHEDATIHLISLEQFAQALPQWVA